MAIRRTVIVGRYVLRFLCCISHPETVGCTL